MPIAITGARVWDGVSASVSEIPLTIRIHNDRIVAIGAEPTLVNEAERVDMPRGSVAIPGLIDAHVHMTLDPAVRSPHDQLETPRDKLWSSMQDRALAMVRAGVTTARDLGGGAWFELTLRDEILAGEIPGPRLLCAGQPVTSPGGHCHFWGGEASSVREIRSVVQRQIEHRSDWIKIMATGGVITKGSSPRAAQFDTASIQAAVEEAGRHGLGVAAHCHGTDGIRNAVQARVRSIEHCSWAGDEGFGTALDEDVARQIGAQPTWVSPTVNSGWTRFLEKDGAESTFLANMRHCFAVLTDGGAKLMASTDAGIPNVAHDALPRSLPVFARFADLSPIETLKTATSGAARGLGVDDETGTLEPGRSADILIVDGSPLDDLGVLERPYCVFARGKLVEV